MAQGRGIRIIYLFFCWLSSQHSVLIYLRQKGVNHEILSANVQISLHVLFAVVGPEIESFQSSRMLSLKTISWWY